MDIQDFDMFIIKRGCVRCNHQWFPRSQHPQRCPRCQTWLDSIPADEETADDAKEEQV